jgi:tetratricopeptide (TPR) repeat protein
LPSVKKEKKVRRWTILKLIMAVGTLQLLAFLQLGLNSKGHAEVIRPIVQRFKVPERPATGNTRPSATIPPEPLEAPLERSVSRAPSLYLAQASAEDGAEQNVDTKPAVPPSIKKSMVPGALSPALKDGIQQYKDENFEEAVEILEQERQRHPESSLAAFFLGMAYKQIMEYPKALENLEDAVNRPPRIKEAVIELVDVCMILEDYEKAQMWLDVAAKQKIAPAKTAFLKGELFARQNQCEEALKAFEEARTIDPSYRQATELKVALCYLKTQKFNEAQERLQTSILLDPQTDMAEFARNYQDVVQARIDMDRPLHATISFFAQHNSNLLTTPRDEAYRLGEDPVDSNALVTSLRLNYTPRLKGPWLFSGQLAATSTLNDKHSTTRDSLGVSLSAVPGYNFSSFTLNLAATYDYSLLRDPGYDDYRQAYRIGPLVRKSLSQRHILEFFAGYARTDYLQAPLRPEEDRDAQALNAYINWIWLFTDNSLLNLRYEFIDEDTDGEWWDNTGHRISGSITFPLIERLSMQLSGDAFFQDFKNNHGLLVNDNRRNETYVATGGIFYDITRKTRLVGQYTYNRAYCNIGYYDYDQHLFMAGVEFRF